MIIGVSGKARSGKGEFAKVAKEKYGAIIVPFAGSLKEEVAEFLKKHDIPFTKENIYGENKFREEVWPLDDKKINEILKDVPRFYNFLIDFGNLRSCMCGKCYPKSATPTYRSLLQWWGTEYRRRQDEDYWVKLALEKCKYKNKLYIIDDLRFKNEAQALLDFNAKLIRVDRPNNPNPISNPGHASECDLDDWTEWDYMIKNDKSLNEYHSLVKNILKDIING